MVLGLLDSGDEFVNPGLLPAGIGVDAVRRNTFLKQTPPPGFSDPRPGRLIDRSCPDAWCSFWMATTIAGQGRACQVATAGNPTMGLSLMGACELTCEYVCRLLNYMRSDELVTCTPRRNRAATLPNFRGSIFRCSAEPASVCSSRPTIANS